MKLKKGDKVKVLSGKDRGKIGKITQVFPDEEKIVVDGVNTMVKHLKRTKSSEKGQRIEFFGPVHASNVGVLCSNCNKVTRVGYKMLEGGKKERICGKCEATLTPAKEEKK